MKLFRTINSKFEPCQPPIQWEGDVRGIIAARRAEDAVQMNRLRLRLLRRPALATQLSQEQTETPLEAAA